MPTVDHIGVNVPAADVAKVIETYKAVLAPLGVTEMYRFGGSDDKERGPSPLVVGLGDAPAHNPFLWFHQREESSAPVHIAIKVDKRSLIDEFHANATKAGWKSHGEPGLRAHYHPNYYCAYVIDDLGNNVEVVSHCPEA